MDQARDSQSTPHAFELRVFGPLCFFRDGTLVHVPQGQENRVLQRVVLNGGSIHRERLMEELWPDLTVSVSAARLRTVLKRLRRHTGLRISARGDTVTIVDQVWCDLDEFIRKATRALSSRDTDAETARQLCLEAQALWLGAPLEDRRYQPWADSLRRRATDLQDRMWVFLEDRE